MKTYRSETVQPSAKEKAKAKRLKELQDSLNNPTYLSSWDNTLGRNVVKVNHTEGTRWEK